MRGKIVRRLIHIVGGLTIVFLALTLPSWFVLPFVGAVAVIALGIEIARFRIPSVGRWLFRYAAPAMKREESFHLTGATNLIIASFLALLIFPGAISTLAIAYSAVGDPTAAFVGEGWGKMRLGSKTLEGSLGGLAASLGIGTLISLVWLDVSLEVVGMGAVAAALFEVLPLPTDDNLRVPLLSAAAMSLFVLGTAG
ncbi:MAG: hypothetical protein HYU86_02140 [Chloroflexi bacterium]|nr:hypothetical protein [Chloroflexota bacterium]